MNRADSKEATYPVFHIGYHKTGTSWFQNVFYPAVTNAEYVSRDVVRSGLLLPNALETGFPGAGMPRGRFIVCEEELLGNLHHGGCNGHVTRAVADRMTREAHEVRASQVARRL